MTNKPHIIIDISSGYVKAGFAGEAGPRSVFPAIIGRPKVPGIMRDYYVGMQAEERRERLILNGPVENGIIKDWDDFEMILDHTFTNELRVLPSEHNVFITETSLNPQANREKLTEIMFDTFDVSGLYLANQALCAIYSAGKFTALVVHSDDGITHIVPVIDTYPVSYSLSINLTGRDLTDYLVKILSERGLQFTTDRERQIAEDIKEKTCYVALDFEEELSRSTLGQSKDTTYEMPNGSVISLGSERFRTPEVLFKPSLIGREFSGIHEQVIRAIEESDVNVRNSLYGNIILSGENTLFAGLPERLTKEVSKLAPANITPKVVAVPERKFLVWIGGSVISSISTFSSMWITKEEYIDAGSSIIVHQKHFSPSASSPA